MQNKVILEIGSDYWTPGLKVVEAFKERGAKFVAGITNEYRPERLKRHKNTKQCYVFCADSRLLPFRDNFFDFVYMNDVLEHMYNISDCFKEIYRVLKPEGVFFSGSGPLWEGGTGHHLILALDGKTYTLDDAIIPPFFHLRLNRKGMEKFLIKDGSVSASHIDTIVNWIYRDNGLNRLRIKDYRKIIKNTGFNIIQLDVRKNNDNLFLLRFTPLFFVKKYFRKNICTIKMDFAMRKSIQKI